MRTPALRAYPSPFQVFRPKTISSLLAAGLWFTAAASAGTVLVGSNAGTPDQVEFLSTTGIVQGTVGPNNASAAAVDSSGNTFFAIPDDFSSTVWEYDPTQSLIGSFVFTPPTDARDSAGYIEDMAWGPGGWLWISTFSGEIYAVSSAGAVQSSFDTGVSSPGVTSDGTYLYTTEGFGFFDPASHFYRRDTSGNVLDTVDTGLNDTLGIGFDSATNSFWIGGFDVVSRVDASGNVLDQFAVDGVHTGLEVPSAVSVESVASPEPATLAFMTMGLAALFLRGRKKAARNAASCVAAVICASSLHAAVTTPVIGTLPAGPQPVGATLTFTASATDTDPGPIRYRFRVRPAAGTFSMVRDFAPNATLAWTPADTDGLFEIEVTAKNLTTSSTAVATQVFQVTPLATTTPVVTATAHPLVALYSAPACPAGSTMRVRFKLAADIAWQSTNLKPCGAATMNFYIGGMRAVSPYQLRHDVIAGARITSGPTLTFTTGALGISLPAVTSPMPLHSPTNTTDGVTLFGVLTTSSHAPQFAVDSTGQVIWYSKVDAPYATRPVPGGTFLQLYGFTSDLGNSGFREIDLAGNLVKETNVECLNSQLALTGTHAITAVHHEARRLANGNYLILTMSERMSTAQGALADIAGDTILVLNSDLQVLWAWDSFDHLDISRKAILNETCNNAPTSCVLFNAAKANDWTHGNAVSLTYDGNLVYSARHQDMVYKIAYANGAGDGHVIWKLGKDGDFTWNSSDPYPWNSHQHDARFDNMGVVSMFDNGNTRISQSGGHSRGMVLSVDEGSMVITPAISVDLGAYSAALGSAQRLSNGNYVFGSGLVGTQTTAIETTPAGTITSSLNAAAVDYRVFRLRDLYSAP